MKRSIQPAIILLLMFTFHWVDAQTLSKDEKKRVVNLYEKAMEQTEEEIRGLSKEQLNFKPTAESWSIADCIEHLALSEDMFREMLQKELESPVDPSAAPDKKFDDKDVYAMITNREQKVKTSQPLEPSNKWESTKETMKAFKKSRRETHNFIQKTDKELRSHYFEMPFGKLDGYQMLLFGAGHQSRHNAQITEIKNNPDFPTS
ncbi:DinB family protein [Robertkochia flava]|uniref:DinB family protein n=1 Tax=Robertkochia flava TaxID=3447986 RepID=UPI001CCFACC6|nr:DinB family protein [Robertkochia marina]